MSNLQDTLEALANDFVRDVVLAIRRASLEDLSVLTGGAPSASRAVASARRAPRSSGKRIRRSPAELEAFAEKIVAEVKRHKGGMLAEDLKRAMGVPAGNVGAKVFTIPLGVALDSGKIKKRGSRRATTYFAP